jgi:L-alanine-DL-glutamate epimerase-like enolase superfamily enzyme
MPTFDLLAELPLEVDDYTLHGLSAPVSPEMVRETTIVELRGGGLTGEGEDVVYTPETQLAFQQAGPVHRLAGRWTIGEFCAHVEALELFPEPPQMPAFTLYRIWAFESAALDLALRQARLSLAQALKRDPAPMRYVASTRLGEPATLEPVSRRLALDPTLRFKLDATSSWTPELFELLVATGAVDSIDLKGAYRGTVVDQPADPVLYRRVAEFFPNAWIEDPDLSTPEAAGALADAHDRITWDAPIHSINDIEALPFLPKMVNIKPSRIGSLRELCATYDHCAAHGIGAYGGGQIELGVGRGQAQYLASLFHADAPNDLAPSAYNLPDPPAGLPRSPLTGDLSAPGFRWPQA